MKHNSLYFLGVFLIVITVFVSCSKEERSPTLIVNVQEADGTKVSGVSVRAWPGPGPHLGGVLNEADFDKTTTTDGSGDAIFEFKASAVLDVDVTYYKQGLDTSITPPIPTIDTLIGRRVVKIEAVRQRSEDNIFNEIVVVK